VHQLNPASARNWSGPLTAAAVARADDERLVKRAQDGDEAALTGLLIHYRPLVYGRARSSLSRRRGSRRPCPGGNARAVQSHP
jgi:hypothetical protein